MSLHLCRKVTVAVLAAFDTDVAATAVAAAATVAAAFDTAADFDTAAAVAATAFDITATAISC